MEKKKKKQIIDIDSNQEDDDDKYSAIDDMPKIDNDICNIE